MNHPHIDPNLGLGRPYGLPLQGGEVAEFPRRTKAWPTIGRLALELVALLAAGAVLFGWLALLGDRS